MEKRDFTAREVAVLVENLEAKFDAVAEVVVPLREDMAEVKERLSAVELRLTSLEDVFRLEFHSLKNRVTRIESKLGL